MRVRPGMYIGSTGSKGLHHLVNEIVDNSIDEFLGGHCKNIIVTMERDGSVTVEDDGRGIPVDMHEKGVSAERIIMTTLHAGGKFDDKSYKRSGGLHGVGASVVNALSSRFTVTVNKDKKTYVDEYVDGGNPITKLIDGLLPVVKNTNKVGTIINFYPDASIFDTIQFDNEIIKKRLKELSFLNKKLRIKFRDIKTNEDIDYYSEEGVLGLLKYINKNKDLDLKDYVYFEGESNDIEVEVAISYVKDFGENIISFCNNINTIEGGTHISGFRSAYTRTINKYARETGVLKEKDTNFDGTEVRTGLVSILSVRHTNPQYEGQTKTKLGNADARGAVDEVISHKLELFFDRNMDILKKILDIAVKSRKIRRAEEKVKENILNKSTALTVNGKLASCKSRDNTKTEIFIVEGDSAGGSAKQGRDRSFQAILPLKGKPLNIEKTNIAKALNNDEISTIISALGCGFGEGLGMDFDLKKLKYSKVIIMTDADVDGSHIRTLLLTFFFRYMPELIHEGKVYIGTPPLYKVTKGKKSEYLYSDNELNKLMSKNKGLPPVIQRYKGLGEMNPGQLWDTTLNPKTRVLKQIIIDDTVSADDITTVLMGNKVPPRREFIEENAHLANVDL